MASHSPHDYEYSRRYLRGDIVDERDPRYFDNYGEPNVRNRDLVPRADPRDSSLSVEEDVRRARSAEPGYYQEDYEYRRTYGSRLDARDSDRHSRYAGSSHGGDDRERKPKHTKTLSKQEKLIAAVAGAALLVGGKELYDRHEAKKEGNGTPIQRNALQSAALAGFGALAAYSGAEFYSKQQARKDQKANYILQRGRDGRLDEYYESDEESDTKKGHKNFLESALAATGLGAAVKSLTGLGDDKHSDTRSRGGSPGSRSVRSRSSSRSGRGASKVQKAAIASLLAGATEAFRVAKEPGGWRGEKTKRILTAAAGAATVDAAHGADHGKLGLAESVIGGLVGNRLINGSRNDIEEDRRTGRSRSRSRARSKDGHGGVGLAALATAGLGALGAKKAFDRSRSRGRDRSDSRDASRDRDRHRSRSRSVVDKARDGLAKLGFGSGALVAADDRRRRDYDDDYDDRSSRHSGRRDDDHVYDDPRYRRRGHRGESRDRSRDRSRDPSRSRDQSRRRGGYGSESDLGDSSEDERRAKKMRGKQVITTGLAAIATVHAAHGVYKSMEQRKARKEAVKEGLLSSQEAKKLRAKAIMQDAASVGIAAIGIKGALSELKEARDMTHECKEWKSEKVRRHEKRLERRQKLGERRRSSSWSTPSRSRNNGYYGDTEEELYILDRRYSAVPQLSQPPLRRDSR
ncbi:hypothetical protein TrVFT333_005742 [Trichoderma virens FT-333]|nr:hypothetical protein TrVFT333_005742 [Trichoderma virens FT-333]